MSAKIATLPKAHRQEPVQISFWENLDDPHNYTNTIDLLDIAPRWVLYTDNDVRKGGRYLESIERTFVHNGKEYLLTLLPARIKDKDGQEREDYPGAREQLVEQVVRKIATSRNRLSEHNGDLLLRSSLYEMRMELAKRKHTYRTAEIKEALMILHGARVEISRVDEVKGSKVNKIVSSSAFPQISFREQGGDNTETTIQFNWLVAEAIKRLQFRQLNYDMIMTLRDGVARWLFSSLSHRVLYGDHRGPIHEFNAQDIQRDCGLPKWKQSRNLLARITRAFDCLQSNGVIERYEAETVYEGQRKDNIIYTVTVSKWFLDEMRQSTLKAVENVNEYRTVVGEEPTSFEQRLDARRKSKLASLRAQRTAKEQARLDGGL